MQATATSEPVHQPSAKTLFRHRTRPEWGLAVCAQSLDRSLRFQFQDGTLRKIARAHVDKLEAVDIPADEAAEALTQLRQLAGLAVAREALSKTNDMISFDEQVAIFLHQYPNGFADPKWSDGMRGEGVKRRLKRHRGAAVAEARELLDEEALRALLAANQHDEIVARAVRVLSGTSIVTKKQLEPLAKLPASENGRVAAAIVELLYGDMLFELRLLRFIQPLKTRKREASWELATALPALVHPSEHVCVRPSTFRTQALWMAPRLQISNTPDARQYMRIVRMAQSVRDKLTEADLEPRDLIDVHDFLWATLRPSARKLLHELVPEPANSDVQAAAAKDDSKGTAEAA